MPVFLYCTKGEVTTPPGVKSFKEFVDLTYVKCKLGHKTGCDYCRDFLRCRHKKRKEFENMSEMYGVCSCGIVVPHGEVINGDLDRAELEGAGYRLLNPCAGDLRFYAAAESISADKPFWFLPVNYDGPFLTCDFNIPEVEAEVVHCYPEVFRTHSVAQRLCRVNICHEKL